MGLQLHETVYGKNFFEHQLPALTRAIEKLAESKSVKETIPSTPFPLADEETCKQLIDVMGDPEKAEAFAKVFYDELSTDDENPASVGFHMARAILHNNIEEFLVAIVGWTSKSLLDIVKRKATESQEVNKDE